MARADAVKATLQTSVLVDERERAAELERTARAAQAERVAAAEARSAAELHRYAANRLIS